MDYRPLVRWFLQPIVMPIHDHVSLALAAGDIGYPLRSPSLVAPNFRYYREIVSKKYHFGTFSNEGWFI